jgi:hypothetical protein
MVFCSGHPLKGEITIMIKVEFSGSGDEVRNEMLKLLGLQGPKAEAASAPADQPAPVKARRARRGRKAAAPSQPEWTEEEAGILLGEIKPNARKILAELANKPAGYKRSDLIQVLGSSEQAIRGQLSSVGSALRRMKKTPSPISKEKVDGEFTYMLDPAVAGVAKKYPVEG